MASASSAPRWLLLIHQLPPSPAYLRVKTVRQLQKIGAVAVKNSVYALPSGDEALESFSWLAREIAAGGGESSLCESSFVGGSSNEAIEALFNRRAARTTRLWRTRSATPSRSSEGAATWMKASARSGRRPWRASAAASPRSPGSTSSPRPTARRRRRRWRRSNGGCARQPPSRGTPREPPLRVRGAVWVTRKGVHVDRIASAWLIKRFIDPKAKLKFVPPKGYVPRQGELRFDMFEAEHTHEGDRCTFEVLARRFGVSDPAVTAIGEVVHDIDLRDGKFGRPETPGVERLITGVALTMADDAARIALGARLFDALYEAWRRKKT